MTRLTDTHGEPIPKFGSAGVKRVMDRPVDVTAGGPEEYAMVFDTESGSYIMRTGEQYTVIQKYEPPQTFSFTKQSEAIEKFIEVCRAKAV